MLYEDGARISEVGIKDGCSVHLAIYSTDQVCDEEAVKDKCAPSV